MSATTIRQVKARQILDSRGKPTLEVTVHCEGGSGTFGVPSGASTGAFEAVELRDGDQSRYGGQGVTRAAANVNVNIAGAIVGADAADQQALDDRMLGLDGTPSKSRLGGNAIVGVSIAATKAAAAAQSIPLLDWISTLAKGITPSRRLPFMGMNLINGGKHAATSLAFQEYKVVPQTDDVAEALNIGTSIMHALKKRIAKEYGPVHANIGDEGGFAPDLKAVRRPLELFMETAAELHLDHRIKFALDVAASSFYDAATDTYEYDGAKHTAEELHQSFQEIIRDFPMLYVEDPFNEDKFEDFAKLKQVLTATYADRAPLIVGDDLTVTNPVMLQKAIDAQAISAVIIKPNQVGTLSETLKCMRLARDHHIECIISHRSGETNDSFIADLAVATGAFAVKFGGPQRGERVAKYNRLLTLLA